MRIVQVLSGPTKFIARKGDAGAEQDISINVIPGIPFEVPDELALSRLKASPALYREATEDDEKFALTYKEEKIQELNALIDVPDFISAKPVDEFNVVDYIKDNTPLTAEKLSQLGRPQLFEIATALEITTPKNTGTEKLIEKILEAVK